MSTPKNVRSIVDCDRPARGRRHGWCNLHRQRAQRWGDPVAKPPEPPRRHRHRKRRQRTQAQDEQGEQVSGSGECPSCGAQQSMAWLCTDCCAAVETMLAAVPALVEQLEVAISKQAKIGGSGKAGKGSAHEQSPINWGVVATRDALLVELALWGDDINVIRKHVKAADIASGIGKAVKNAYQAIDRMADRKYLGRCMNQIDGLKCHEELWVRPGAKEIRCKSCRYEHNVADRRLDMIEIARDMIVTVKDASVYMGEVGGVHVTEDRIRGYLRRKRIAYRPLGDKQGVQIGELWDVVMDDSEKRAA